MVLFLTTNNLHHVKQQTAVFLLVMFWLKKQYNVWCCMSVNVVLLNFGLVPLKH